MNTTPTDEAILKTDVLGRVRTPRERREHLLDEFERSGLSGKKFAALAGIKYPTFATWAQKRRRQRGTYPAVGQRQIPARLPDCHRSLQNQPVRVESKPATPRWFIHIKLLDVSKGLINLFNFAILLLQLRNLSR